LNAPVTTPQDSAQNPLRTTSPPATTPAVDPTDRYATPALTTVLPIAPNPPATPTDKSFTDSWPTIQAALDRGDLKQAHQLLSKWHNNDSLSPTDTQKVETLLSQLAGTVIYSTEHQLEPARVVKPGDTLETIAKEYNVPSQLLAKINGVQQRAPLRPGQELKVVRGPFSAVVDLSRNEVALSLDDRFAGRFRIVVPQGITVNDGQWVVDQKLAGPANTANRNISATTPAPADRTIVLRSATAPGANTLVITSDASTTRVAANVPSLRVSTQDAE
jgi:LysM repeat protein